MEESSTVWEASIDAKWNSSNFKKMAKSARKWCRDGELWGGYMGDDAADPSSDDRDVVELVASQLVSVQSVLKEIPFSSTPETQEEWRTTFEEVRDMTNKVMRASTQLGPKGH